MGKTSHEKSFVDFEKGYEQNLIGLKGIVYFGVGLLILIIITFGLMWALENVMEDNSPDKRSSSPMAMSELERLPPEPRLQSAPGFGVNGPNGRVRMELTPPQAEYWELKKEWDNLRKNGEKDPKTGTLISMPIDAAKAKLLSENVKAKTGQDAENALTASRMIVSDSSAGRIASERRR